jgi:hypothetical protein
MLDEPGDAVKAAYRFPQIGLHRKYAGCRHVLFGEEFLRRTVPPEVKHTPEGQAMLENFLYKVCGCQGNWTMESLSSRK